MNNIDQDKGAYVYYDNKFKTNVLFLYIKLQPSELERALPISYVEDKHNNYFNALFVNGKDYIGQNNYENIVESINNENMVNILTKEYDEVVTELKELKVSEFNNYVSFAKEQLKF